MLEMGDPLSILELAHRMIRLSGLHPGTDIPIRITGPRVGEKIHEQLHGPDEELSSTEHPSILRLQQPLREGSGLLTPGLAELRVAAADRNEVRVRRVLFDLVSDSGTEADSEEDIDEEVKGLSEPFVIEHDLSA
jgi:O-antigen biosynthesis protein WbqV